MRFVARRLPCALALAGLLALAPMRFAAAEPASPPEVPQRLAAAAPDRALGFTLDPSLAKDRWHNAVTELLRQPVAEGSAEGVLVVGSSSIYFWKDAAADLQPYPIVRRGIGGFGLTDLARYARAFMTGVTPRLVVIYAGENDIDAGRSPAEVVAALEKIVASWDSYRGPIVFMGLKPSPLRWGQWQKMEAVNAAVRQLALRMPRLRYVDVQPTLMGGDGRPDPQLFMPDGLHLNRKGYERWAGLLRPAIAATLAR